MANIDYTYDQVLKGTGRFKKESSSTPSMSVKRMQMKLYRKEYSINEPDGYFGTNTENALKDFQKVHGLPVTGVATDVDLQELDDAEPDTAEELLGRELTHDELISGHSSGLMTSKEALARCIYGEDSIHAEGQKAVAKEIYNRMHSARFFCQVSDTWKGIVYGYNTQYQVMTGGPSNTKNSRAPDIYSSSWLKCVSLANTLVQGSVPSSQLGKQCYHLANGYSYPANSKPGTRIKIPSNGGNIFFDYEDPPT